MASKLAPVIFLPHGGGPLPLLGDSAHKDLISYLRGPVHDLIRNRKDDIKAIALFTAHWTSNEVRISSGSRHSLYFDYYGFPKETYEYTYDAAGSPKFAKLIADKLKSDGIKAQLDSERGWDHGVFVPMKLVIPEGDIPIVQMSVLESEDPEQCLRIGESMHDLRSQGVAIIGSGMSFHNLSAMITARNLSSTEKCQVENAEFDAALVESCTSKKEKRREELLPWRQKYSLSSYVHPVGSAEHFLPLIVCAGAGGDSPGKHTFTTDYLGRFRLSGFTWE